jgi:hypothetical protein
MASAFHLISLPVASEEVTLQAALDTLAEVEPGESVFFSEAVAWTAAGSGLAFARLLKAARQRNVNLLATLNLGGELILDLPGHRPGKRYHAAVIFTRHGHVHVPQAKCFPDALERAGGPDQDALPVSGYPRSNLVRLDMDEQLIEVRFLLGADAAMLTDHTPVVLACDVLFSVARLPSGADELLRQTLADARSSGLTSTTVQINGTLVTSGTAVCKKVEEAADNGRAIAPKRRWPDAARFQRRFYRYAARRRDKDPASALVRLDKEPARKGRIPLVRPPRAKKIEPGIYPITIVL